MSEPTFLAMIRDGQARYYLDKWAGETVYRELVWGPEAFEQWLVTREYFDQWDETANLAVVANFDRKLLTFLADSEILEIPKIGAIFNRLVATAWPGYEIVCAAIEDDLLVALGRPKTPEWSEDKDYARIEYRPESVASAAGDIEDDLENFDDDFDEDFEEEPSDDFGKGQHGKSAHQAGQHRVRNHVDGEDEGDDDADDESDIEDGYSEYEFDETELRAWVTIIGMDGSIEHRQLTELPQELLQAKPSAIAELAALPACEVPAEIVVREGLWVELGSRTVSVWGGAGAQAALPVIESAWQGWTVHWAQRGYAQHCEATGPAGTVLSTEAALGRLVPHLLSTERVTMQYVLSAVGGAVKKTAIKATGCLLIFICLPILIFGLVSGNWKSVGLTIAITVALVSAAFKFAEWQLTKRLKRTFRDAQDRDHPEGPPAAGPLDKAKRRAALDELLSAAGLPTIKKIEPHFKSPVS